MHPEIVVFPPLDEQVLIASYLDNAVAEIKQVITRTEREIALLREYRTRLIADVVTGKLDMRGVQFEEKKEEEERDAEWIEDGEGEDLPESSEEISDE